MHIIATVTNDLNYDQRMQRICTTFVAQGHVVTLIGRELDKSLPLAMYSFQQQRFSCTFNKGALFYLEYNVRLFFHLLFRSGYDALYTVDLDTMPGGCTAALLRRKRRIFDAHEYFTEVPEVVNRPLVKAIWGLVGKIFVPTYHRALTVGPALADIFTRKYGIPFVVVRNVPMRASDQDKLNAFIMDLKAENTTILASDSAKTPAEDYPKIILYQGALNEGRGLEQAILAMKQINPGAELWLAGEGDLSTFLRDLAQKEGLSERVKFLGYRRPEELKQITVGAWLGLNLLENKGKSYYYSLANKFFDYIQAEVPSLCMDFPEYSAIVKEDAVAQLLPDIHPDTIARHINALLEENEACQTMRRACRQASGKYIWERESQKLFLVMSDER